MKKILLFASLAAITLGACQSDSDPAPRQRVDIPLTRTEMEMTEANNKFAFDLFKTIYANEEKDNFLVSPLSASIALSMTTNGAATQTLEEMKTTLGFADYSIEEMNEYYAKLTKGLLEVDNTTELGIANSIWIKQDFPVLQPFIDTNKKMYDAEVRTLDFGLPTAPDIINQWCSDKTNKRITEVITKIDEYTRMFLINALYFKGTWKHEFDKKKTARESFTALDGSKAEVDMMAQECTLPFTSQDGVSMVELPYGNEAFSMVVLMPEAGKPLADLMDKLTPDNWSKWIENLKETTIDLKLPRFKMEYDRELNDDLKQMGIVLAFDDNKADFSKMSEEFLFISLVKQNTFIEVNEQGTEAAAVTVVIMDANSIGAEPSKIAFYVNRPCVYAIKEKSTGAILFMGRITNMK